MKFFLFVIAAVLGLANSQELCGAGCLSTGGICIDDGQGSMYCSCASGYSQKPGDRTSCVAAANLVMSGCRFVGCGYNADCKIDAVTGKSECKCRPGFEKNPFNKSSCIRKAVLQRFNGCKYIGCGDRRYGRCETNRYGVSQCVCYQNAKLDLFTQKCKPKVTDQFAGMWPLLLFGEFF